VQAALEDSETERFFLTDLRGPDFRSGVFYRIGLALNFRQRGRRMSNVFGAIPIDSLGQCQNILCRFKDENRSEPRAANVRSGDRLSQL
jgi:hypothetical protein